MIERSNHQKWYQKPKPFERNAYGPVKHSDWLDKVLVRTRWSENRSGYCSGLVYFTMATKLTITRYLGAHVLPKALYFSMWLNSTFENILSMRIKYNDSIYWNNFVMRAILTVNFFIWSKITTITFARYYLCFELNPFNIFLVLSLRGKYYDNNKLKRFVMIKKLIVGFDWIENYNSALA